MKTKIKIEKINYFGEANTCSIDYNAKVIYTYNDKMYHAMIYIDYFNKKIYINKKIQNRECNIKPGLLIELNKLNHFK